MRTEVNLQTGEITEHEDAPVTWEVPVVVVNQPTKEELLAKLLEIQSQLEALQ